MDVHDVAPVQVLAQAQDVSRVILMKTCRKERHTGGLQLRGQSGMYRIQRHDGDIVPLGLLLNSDIGDKALGSCQLQGIYDVEDFHSYRREKEKLLAEHRKATDKLVGQELTDIGRQEGKYHGKGIDE